METTRKKARLCAGITKDNEIYFIEITLPSKEQDYFSMTAFTVNPIEEKDGEEQAREYLNSGEAWKMAVENDQTELGKDEWNDSVLAIVGWEHVLDTSLYPETVMIEGGNYSFLSGSCGQHQERKLKTYYIPKHRFNELMRCWDTYHLKKKVGAKDLAMLEEVIASASDELEARQVKMATQAIISE